MGVHTMADTPLVRGDFAEPGVREEDIVTV